MLIYTYANSQKHFLPFFFVFSNHFYFSTSAVKLLAPSLADFNEFCQNTMSSINSMTEEYNPNAYEPYSCETFVIVTSDESSAEEEVREEPRGFADGLLKPGEFF